MLGSSSSCKILVLQAWGLELIPRAPRKSWAWQAMPAISELERKEQVNACRGLARHPSITAALQASEIHGLKQKVASPQERSPRVSSGLHTIAHMCPHPAHHLSPIKVNMRTLCVTSFKLLSDTSQNTRSAAPFNLYNITKKWVKTIFSFPDW